jgi:ATP-dependent Clp protease ATP-binding subunit ClpA
LDVSIDAREWLMEKGYDPLMGARPLARGIQDHIKKPLAEMVLFGELADSGGNVAVVVKDDELLLEVKDHKQLPEPVEN